jgi:hypothetical protein
MQYPAERLVPLGMNVMAAMLEDERRRHRAMVFA